MQCRYAFFGGLLFHDAAAIIIVSSMARIFCRDSRCANVNVHSDDTYELAARVAMELLQVRSW